MPAPRRQRHRPTYAHMVERLDARVGDLPAGPLAGRPPLRPPPERRIVRGRSDPLPGTRV